MPCHAMTLPVLSASLGPSNAQAKAMDGKLPLPLLGLAQMHLLQKDGSSTAIGLLESADDLVNGWMDPLQVAHAKLHASTAISLLFLLLSSMRMRIAGEINPPACICVLLSSSDIKAMCAECDYNVHV